VKLCVSFTSWLTVLYAEEHNSCGPDMSSFIRTTTCISLFIVVFGSDVQIILFTCAAYIRFQFLELVHRNGFLSEISVFL